MKYLRRSLAILPLLVVALCAFVFFKSKYAKPKIKYFAQNHYYYATSEKPFVVVIPSYNNENFCEKNLTSVFNQKYKNYRVIYIDDCSKDETYSKVKGIIERLGEDHRVTLIRNERNLGALENLYRAIHSCQDQEIVTILDGDDWFSHEWVLEKLNSYYSNSDIWLTYGCYLSYPQFTKGECSRPLPDKVFKETTLREYSKRKGMLTSHLRTFYAGLFKKVKLQDLLYKGNFFDSTYDGAMMFPMIEMAGKGHLFFVPEVLYIYNRTNPLNDDKVNFEKQQRCWQTILDMPVYKELGRLNFNKDDREVYKADVVAFSFDRPLQLYAFLESFYKYVKNYDKITVLYRCSREEFQKGYEEVMSAFPEVTFCRQGDEPKKDFKPLVIQSSFKKGSADYIIYSVDDIVVKDEIDFDQAIRELKKRDAYGFYFRLGKHVDYCYTMSIKQGIPFTIPFDNQVHAWVFEEGKGDWNYPNSVDMTLYKKSDIEETVKALDFVNPNTFEGLWAEKAQSSKVGLCYEASKIVNIPLGLVNPSTNRHMNLYSAEELLTFFNQGLKLDITPLHQMRNISAHIEYHPLFVDRK